MFTKLFGKPKMAHPTLGEISFRRGQWNGGQFKIFGSESVRVRVPGNDGGPSSAAVSAIEALSDASAHIMRECAQKLYDEHYINGKYSSDAEGFDDREGYPNITSADQIWDYANTVSVIADPYSTGAVTQIQIGIVAAWDEDHDLGVILEDGKITDFNGSIPPF